MVSANVRKTTLSPRRIKSIRKMPTLTPFSARLCLYQAFIKPALAIERRTIATRIVPNQRHNADNNGINATTFSFGRLETKPQSAPQPRETLYTPQTAHAAQYERNPPGSRRELRPRRPPLPPMANRAFQMPYDEEIGSFLISLIDRDGVHHPRVRLRDALADLDRAAEHLVQVAASDATDSRAPPSCRIFQKSNLREMLKVAETKEKARKKLAKSSKEMEIYWVIEQRDLEMKLSRLEKFLSEGRIVEFSLTRKRRSREVDETECRRLLTAVQQVAETVKAKEIGKPSGALGKKMILKFQGTKTENAPVTNKGSTTSDSDPSD